MSAHMQTIIILALVMGEVKAMSWNLPANKVQFNPVPKEEPDPKVPAQLAKETTTERIETLPSIFNAAKLSIGTNQKGKLIYAPKSPTQDKSQDAIFSEGLKNFISLPIIAQPYENYKILIATAPPQIRLYGEKAEPVVIYVVFTDDDSRATKAPNIPSIYFVNKHDGLLDRTKKEKAFPLFIVDNNRTVTGLRSKEIAKYVSFKRRFD
ncbi:hypothetical protein MSG28_000969 [Choristoneura fumiferana]|uniref:Uncharacterized protein n=1 Tax=Choristoneura fumiferana TaxID=7141 RepID=A0ACC0K361_CHOFU|nr:hypothetical protein MSG28_000969 [Choristoneura fumiferana]